MRLSSFSLRDGTRQIRRNLLKAAIPLIAALAFGCSNNGQSIKNLAPAEIERMHSKIARKEYRIGQAEIKRREATWLCTTDCDVTSREVSGGFNSEKPVILIDVLPNTTGGYYHTYAYDKESGKLLWEGIGDSMDRTFATRNEDGTIKTVKKTRRENGAWITVRVGDQSIITDAQEASQTWYRAVSDFLSYTSL